MNTRCNKYNKFMLYLWKIRLINYTYNDILVDFVHKSVMFVCKMKYIYYTFSVVLYNYTQNNIIFTLK